MAAFVGKSANAAVTNSDSACGSYRLTGDKTGMVQAFGVEIEAGINGAVTSHSVHAFSRLSGAQGLAGQGIK